MYEQPDRDDFYLCVRYQGSGTPPATTVQDCSIVLTVFILPGCKSGDSHHR